jgi:hypothetical protein
MTNPRQNLPSASSFSADVACPGRQNLIRSIPESERVIELADPMAERGTRIHHALETGDVSQLSGDEMEDYTKAKEYVEQAKNWWLDPILQNPHFIYQGEDGISVREVREKRLWLHLGIDPVLSGQPDVVFIAGHSALVLDLKSGWTTNLTPSERNWQLRVLAVLVSKNYNVQAVTVGFIKPKSAKLSAVDMTFYGPMELVHSEDQILKALDESKRSDSHRHSGPHCRYCPVKPQCPEAASMSLLPSVMANVTKGVSKADVGAAVARLGPADWKFIHERASVIRNVLDSATKCLKGLPPDSLTALGLQIGEGQRLDPITNTIGAYKALEHVIKPELLWGCLSFEKGKIVEAVMESKGMTKKDAQIWVRETLAPFITEERASGSLEEV